MRINRLLILPAITLAFTLTACGANSGANPKSPPHATAATAKPSAGTLTGSGPDATTAPTPQATTGATVDTTNTKSVVLAWLDAINRHDAQTLVQLGDPQGTSGQISFLEAAAKVASPNPTLSNITVTGEEKSFFDDDTHKAVDVKIAYSEQGKDYTGKVTLFQKPGSKTWMVFTNPLVGPSVSYDSDTPAGDYSVYIIANGQKTLVYTMKAKNAKILLNGLFPGTYILEQDGPGNIKKTTQDIELLSPNVGLDQ